MAALASWLLNARTCVARGMLSGQSNGNRAPEQKQKHNKINKHVYGDTRNTTTADGDEADSWAHGPHHQRHGAHRAGGLLVADLRGTSPLRRADGRLRDVDWNCVRAGLVLRHRHQLRGIVKTVPRRGIVL